MSDLDRRAKVLVDAYNAVLERRIFLIGKFIPFNWLSLDYSVHKPFQQPKIVATAPK